MADDDGKIARIARIWRGRTVPEKADAYAAYLLEIGVKPLAKKALGAIALGSLLAGGCTGCASFPDGGVDELDGVDAVEEVMRDYGDGLGPDPAPANP